MRRSIFDLSILIVTLAALAVGQTDTRPNPLEEDGDKAQSALEQYQNRAYPNADITLEEQQAASAAFHAVSKLPGGKKTNWQLVGPEIGNVPSGSIVSGRVTSLALSPLCSPTECKIFVGAAGGGVWKADNALEPQLNWAPSGAGIPSNAIGTIIFDPTDSTGRTLYAGTGEPNQSIDSEAGVGLFKSVDLGRTWSPVGTSSSISAFRAIGSVVIDPSNANHIYIGTSLARFGPSSVGGAGIPPGLETGLYESLDGGDTWIPLITSFIFPNGIIVPAQAAEIHLDPRDPNTVYASFLQFAGLPSAGIFRRSRALDGDDDFHQVLSVRTGDRTAFSVTVKNGKTRIYAGIGGVNFVGLLLRNDNADLPAAAVRSSWTLLFNATKGTPGFASFNFCRDQCWYDMFVASPPGQPDTLWLGGDIQGGEISAAHPPSNGRAVQRSVNAGVGFTDMTRDAQTPSTKIHTDEHAIAFAPFNPDIAFIGSDGGVFRTGGSFVDASADCASRGVTGVDLIDCTMWLSAIPARIDSLNRNLATLQFQSVSVNPQDPLNDLLGGTQDNGTWAYNGHGAGSWFQSIGSDGGQSGFNVASPNIRAHMFYSVFGDVNFQGSDPLGWDWWADPLSLSSESASAFFYPPFIADPKVGGTWFIGMSRVWRTQDNGGSQTFLEQFCNQHKGITAPAGQCGDWAPLGSLSLTGTGFGSTKTGRAVSAVQRAVADNNTLWTATGTGRLFISKNADLHTNAGVTFARIDTDSTPNRFINGIAVDPGNPNHAYVSFSGYNLATPATPGHVFEVTYNGVAAAWNDISHNLGDMPITAIVIDSKTGDLFAGTDFGVLRLPGGGNTWEPAAGSLPEVAVSGLAIHSGARVLYAATHGRGIWSLNLSK